MDSPVGFGLVLPLSTGALGGWPLGTLGLGVLCVAFIFPIRSLRYFRPLLISVSVSTLLCEFLYLQFVQQNPR